MLVISIHNLPVFLSSTKEVIGCKWVKSSAQDELYRCIFNDCLLLVKSATARTVFFTCSDKNTFDQISKVWHTMLSTVVESNSSNISGGA